MQPVLLTEDSLALRLETREDQAFKEQRTKTKSLDMSYRNTAAPSSASLGMLGQEFEKDKEKRKAETDGGFLSRLFGSKRQKMRSSTSKKDLTEPVLTSPKPLSPSNSTLPKSQAPSPLGPEVTRRSYYQPPQQFSSSPPRGKTKPPAPPPPDTPPPPQGDHLPFCSDALHASLILHAVFSQLQEAFTPICCRSHCEEIAELP